MQVNTLKKSGKILLSALSVSILIGCSGGIKIKTDLTCYWVEELRFEAETKQWLNQLGYSEEKILYLESNDWESWKPEIQEIMVVLLTRDDWPESFERDLENLGDHNELVAVNC